MDTTIAPGGTAGTGVFNVGAGTAASLSSTSSFAIGVGGATPGTYDQLNFTNAATAVTIDPASTLAASLVGSIPFGTAFNGADLIVSYLTPSLSSRPFGLTIASAQLAALVGRRKRAPGPADAR